MRPSIKARLHFFFLFMAHVTSSRITSIHEVSVICRGTLSGSTISTDGNPNYLSKSFQYLLRSIYIHVTGRIKTTSVHNSTIRACGILWDALIVSDGHGESDKSNQYLFEIFIHTCNKL